MRVRMMSGLIVTTVLAASPLLAGFAGTDVFVPLVGYGRGVSVGSAGSSATLWLTNPSTSANAAVVVQLYAGGATANPVATTKLVLGPSESGTIEDPLRALFGIASGEGSLRFVSSAEVLVAIHANADGTVSASTASAGAGFEAVPASFAIAAGQSSTLLGVAETSDEGYSFSIVETSGQAATVQVSVIDDEGTVLAGRAYDLPAHGDVEGNVADLSSMPVNLSSGRLKVAVTAGSGSVLAYGVRTTASVANAAGFSMSFADNLLVSPFTAITSLNALTGPVTIAPGVNVTVATTPNGGGQPGGTITIDTPAYTAGTGLALANHQFSLLTAYSLPQGCGGGQLAAWNGSGWACVNDATYAAGSGLSLSGNQFSVNFGGDGSATTASRSDHTHVGQSWSTSSGGVLSVQDSDPNATALYVASTSPNFAVGAVRGDATATTGQAIGVLGTTAGTQINAVGVRGDAFTNGSAIGVAGIADGAGTYGVLAQAMGASSTAGYFLGNVDVTGTLSKGAGSFKIDDPIDPANKFLYHSFVESPDMMNIYNGNVVTDAQGFAVVTMPAWFEALNRDFRYQLTVIGQFAQAIVAKEMAGGSFTIQTDKPDVKVSWQVTGIRQDPYANAHRIPVEQEKAANERGNYLHPELYGLGPERLIGPVLAQVARPATPAGAAASTSP